VSRVGRHEDGGSAVVEFVWLTVVLLLPLVYLVVTLARVQAAAFAVDGASRAAARAVTSAPDEETGRRRALDAVGLALRDQGFDVDPAAVTRVTCAASGCLTPASRVGVEVVVDVGLPAVPAVLDRLGATVTVRSVHEGVVDAFRAAPVPRAS